MTLAGETFIGSIFVARLASRFPADQALWPASQQLSPKVIAG